MGKIVETVLPEEAVTLSPLEQSVSLTIPPRTFLPDPDTPATVTLKSCLPTHSFKYPEGYGPVSTIHNASANKNFEKSVHLKFEHFAKADNEERAKEIILFHAKSVPFVTNGRKEYVFQPIEECDANVVVQKHHCTVSSRLSGFIGAGTLQNFGMYMLLFG